MVLTCIVVFQIWDMVESKQGYLTRVGLYKALALTALAQQGKTVSEKLLENFSGHGMFVWLLPVLILG